MRLLLLLALLMLRPDQIEWLRQDWTRGPKHLLGVNQWDGQKQVVRALQRHRRVGVTSAHKVGKTHLVGSLVNTLLPLYPNARIITSASTGDQVKENVWGEIRSQRAAAKMALGGRMLPSDMLWTMGPLWYAKGISTDEPESFQGKHSEDGIVIVILDECQSIDRKIVTAAKTMTSDSNGYLLAIANPTIPSGWFYEACTTDPTWHRVTLSCYDHPNILEGRKVMPGPTQDLIDTFEGTDEEGPRLRGEFNENASDTLISMRALKSCHSIDLADLEADGRHMGVDIADDGGDECVACITDHRRVIKEVTWRNHGQDGLMRSAGQIQAIAHELEVPAENVHVDGIGVGAGVVSRLHELGFYCDNVNFGAGPEGDWSMVLGDYVEFKNRRAELYWVARVLINDAAHEIAEEYRFIHADLAAPKWGYISDRKVQIEPKVKIKKRLGRSPDHGDAFVLSLSRMGSMRPQFFTVDM